MAYASVDDLKTYIGGEWDDSDDDLLTDLIARSQAIVERATGRIFEAAADSTRHIPYDNADGRTLWLSGVGELAAITTVTNCADSTGEAVTAGDYFTLPRHDTPIYALRLRANSDIDWAYDADPDAAVAITGRWAFSVTPPGDIVHVTLRLAAFLYRQRSNYDVDLDRPLITSDGATILPVELPRDVRGILSRYRRLSL